VDLQILNVDDVHSLVKECALLRQFILATYWAPEEGTEIPVFRLPIDKDLDRQLVKWLLDNGAPRYVPKKERK
jgi:hypothetical protein